MALDLVVVGRIGSPFGLSGWLHVVSFTDPQENIINYEPWLIADSGLVMTRDVVRPDGDAYIVKFRGIDNRNLASNFRGRDLAIEPSLLPPTSKNEFYWRDLIGLEVLNKNAVRFGFVSEIFDNGAHSVLVVRGKGRKTVLIPAVQSVIIEVKGHITVDWQAT